MPTHRHRTIGIAVAGMTLVTLTTAVPASAVPTGDYAVTATTAIPQVSAAALDQDTHRIFAASLADDQVFVVEADTHAVLTRIPVGTAPAGVAVNQRTDTVYVINQADSTVSVIDAKTRTVTGTVRAGLYPTQVVVDEAANTFIVRSSGFPGYHSPGTPPAVLIFDAATDALIHQTDFETLGAIAVDPGRDALYATVGDDIREYDPATGTERRPVTTLPDATTMAVDPSTHYLYITTSAGRITVLDPATGAVRATVALPDPDMYGYQIDLDPAAGRLFAVSRAQDAVFVIALASDTIVQALDLGVDGPPDRVLVDPVSHTVYVSEVGPGILATLTLGAASAGPEPTVTALSVAPADLVAGAPTTATATVSPVPDGGSVAFVVDGQAVDGCTAQVVDGLGHATCALSAPAASRTQIAGTHVIGAQFAGTAGFAVSAGTASVRVKAGAATRLHLVNGDNQTEHASGGFTRPLAAIALDGYGNPVANAQVRFTVTPPLATFATDTGQSTTATVRSQDGGRVTSPYLQAGPDGGTFTVSASVVGAPSGGGLSFTGTVTPVAYVSLRLIVAAQARPGSAVSARVTLANDGPSPAGWILGAIAVPAGLSCTSSVAGQVDGNTVYFSLLGVVAGARLSAVVTCAVPAAQRGTLTWVAAATSGTPDPRPEDNLVTATTTLL